MVQSNIVPDGFKTKATKLGTTAGNQSKSEVASTQDTDLDKQNNAQSGLANKSGELAAKALALYDAAKTLETAATTDTALKPLKDTAGALKNAAGTSGGTSGLFKAAEELAKQAGSPAEDQANQVINAFEEVEKHYLALMKQAGDSKLTEHPEVIQVVKAYHLVKNTYYQMLIGYRIRYLIGNGSDGILQKASDLHTKASNLANAPGLSPQDDPQKDLKEQLKGLANELKNATDNNAGLQQALNQLKTAEGDTNIVENATKVIEKYKKVKEAYEKIKAKDSDYTKLAARVEYGPVTTAFNALDKKFEALKKSYENVLILRVQELSNLAQALSTKASDLKAVSGLTKEANALAEAASKDPSEGLAQKAKALVGAINGPGDTTSPATEVITAFDKVTKAYDDLANKNEYKQKLNSALAKQGQVLVGDELKVKEVGVAYANLKAVYDKILYFTKIKHYAKQMESKVQSITSPATAKEVKTVIAKLKSINSLLPADPKFTVQNDIESIKNAVYGAQFEEK
ncbi:Tpr-related protein family member, putative [Theileria annulata]|uniref:Tpr-related protein family member, putative n=1 Tax=Theileria annulata TaxID=5874 RepID=Q4UFU9_THEAN|nr:Tpr-related protein family member, putative [Theileria annulata]CAI74209.1 Tpr-related protein family member, putative [Theileria annulata]|eukprot:XP_951941.1 Tpr-related protein family member, putative [Theileria annulata]